MTPSTPARPARPTRAVVRGLAAVTVLVAATAALLAPGAGWQHPERARAASATVAAPTQFRVANFNVLGYHHTAPGGARYGKYASGTTRMVWTTQLMTKYAVDLVGFQEFEPKQYDKFHELMGSSWGVWPGTALGSNPSANSVAWKTSVWTAISKSTYKAPYSYGSMQIRPLVLLRNNQTGQLVWLLNTHNASNFDGVDHQKWRDAAERIQADLVNKLQRNDPSIPVLFTGDMNDFDKFYCPLTYLTDLESASGGVHTEPAADPYTCQTAAPWHVDWIMGTKNARFSGYHAIEDDFVKKTSDHPFFYATTTIQPQPARAAGVKRVVVVDIQGLRSGTVHAGRAPYVSALMQSGTSTLAARPDDATRRALPNTISLLTSRPVPKDRGGHGVTTDDYAGPSVHAAAGQYVSSVFDIAHNLGMRTALFSGDLRSRLAVKSWDSSLAGSDKYGVDNGRGKIDARAFSSHDTDVVTAARSSLATRPARVTVVQLGDAMRAGKRYGWQSSAYYRAVAVADRRLKAIVGDIRASATLGGSTLVIVTSSAPGSPASLGYGVPMVVWGPGVPQAGSLYRLNPAYTRPSERQQMPSSGTAIHVGTIANLAASALTLPAIPRSRMNAHLGLDVFGP